MLDTAGLEETTSGGWEGESRSHHPCKEEPLRLLCQEKGEKARKVNRCPHPHPGAGFLGGGWQEGSQAEASEEGG